VRAIIIIIVKDDDDLQSGTRDAVWR